MATTTKVLRMRVAAMLFFAGPVVLIFSANLPDRAADVDCAERGRNNAQVLTCVAKEAEAGSLGASELLAVLGVGAVIAAIALGASSLERVMSLHQAAQHLETSVAEVRRAVEAGTLRPVKRNPAGVFVRSEDVLRLGSSKGC
ncbi:MAG: hypothetical protein ACR2L3_02460 [Actinomycetota bacterium]